MESSRGLMKHMKTIATWSISDHSKCRQSFDWSKLFAESDPLYLCSVYVPIVIEIKKKNSADSKKSSQLSYFISLYYLQSDKQDEDKKNSIYNELMSDYQFQDILLFLFIHQNYDGKLNLLVRRVGRRNDGVRFSLPIDEV